MLKPEEYIFQIPNNNEYKSLKMLIETLVMKYFKESILIDSFIVDIKTLEFLFAQFSHRICVNKLIKKTIT